MKKLLPIIILLASLATISCRQPKKSLGVTCGFGYPLPDGPGLESKLKRFEYVGIMDTVASWIDLDITYLNPVKGQVEAPAIGVTLIIYKSGEEELFFGTVSDAKGKAEFFMDSGIYDLAFSYTGCNTLLVKNANLLSGGMYEVSVMLGGQGKERKTFEVDLLEVQGEN